MRSVIIFLAALAVISDAARFPVGRPRPDNEGPSNSPNGPDGPPGGIPGGGGLGSASEISVPSQENIEMNMGSLEVNLEKTENVMEVVEVMVEVVSAILADPDCVEGDIFSQGSLGVGASTECKSAACKCVLVFELRMWIHQV